MSDDRPIPPYPNVLLGRGRWLRIIKVLRARGTQLDRQIADNIEQQIQS